MRCKKHFADLSSSVGVCASCLRERLFILIAAQTKAQSIDDHRPPPIIFPRSVSPLISRRKCDDSEHHHIQQHNLSLSSDKRFYSTPQIGPSGNYIAGDLGLFKKKSRRFSLITNIFRSRAHKRDSENANPDSDSRFSVSIEPPGTSASISSSSLSSWLSGILPVRRRKQSRLFSLDETATTTAAAASGGLRIQPGFQDRGLSPAIFSDDGEDDDDECCESGYVSERQTPARGNRPRSNLSRNVSGLAFCLSPLVRASPNRQWNQKGMPPEMVFPGEIRVSVKPNIPYASAFCKNRSRKLADFGRSNPNH